MSQSPINYITLPGGLRLVHRHAPGHVAYLGVTVNVGSRDEYPDQEGLAHFVEHTIFKGTKRRKSWHIINRMEAVGGELNAFTTKEETTIYTVAPAGNTDRAAELLIDLITASVFPTSEIDREREVVLDEINSYLDSPSDAVFDDYEEAAYQGSPIAHNILGNIATVKAFTSDDCRRWLLDHYRTESMVAFYAGPEQCDKVARILSKYATLIPQGHGAIDRSLPPKVDTFAITRDIDSHQAHTVAGARIDGLHSPRRHAQALLTNILGGPGMNSRLNVALRERRGLVYTVEAASAWLTDCGLTTVYFGCDPDDTRRCLRLVNNEIDRLAQSPMSQRALDASRKQYMGQLTVASASLEQTILSAARATLHRGHAVTQQEMTQWMMAITPEEIQREAQSLLPLSTLTLV